MNLYSFQNLSRWFLNEFKLGADSTLSGKEFHKSTTRRLKKSCLTLNSEDCFCSLESGLGLSFLFVAGITHLRCIVHADICTLQSYHPDISYKPLMVDRVVLIGMYIRDLLV